MKCCLCGITVVAYSSHFNEVSTIKATYRLKCTLLIISPPDSTAAALWVIALQLCLWP